jgi:hypothetical protein
MKNGKFETQAEIYKFLLDGGVVTNLDDSCDLYVELRNGTLMYNTEGEDTLNMDEQARFHSFSNPENWYPFSQVKLLKKLKQANDWIERLEAKILKNELRVDG